MNLLTQVRRGFLAVAVLSLAALTLVACGDDDDDAEAATNGNGDNHVQDVVTHGDIEIHGVYARATVNDVTAVYMTLKNNGLEDTLVAASADVGSEAQLHEIVTEGASSTMRQVEGGIVVPANGEVEFKPGGYHVMLLGLESPLEAGSGHIHVDLTFEEAGMVTLSVPIQALDAENGASHGDGDDHEEGEDNE